VPSPLVQDTDEVDDRVRTAQERGEHPLVVHVCADQLDARQHEQIAISLSTAGRDRDAIAGPDEMGAERASDETGSAEQTNVSRWRLDRHKSKNIPARKIQERTGRRRGRRQRGPTTIERLRPSRVTSSTSVSASCAATAAASARLETGRSFMRVITSPD